MVWSNPPLCRSTRVWPEIRGVYIPLGLEAVQALFKGGGGEKGGDRWYWRYRRACQLKGTWWSTSPFSPSLLSLFPVAPAPRLFLQRISYHAHLWDTQNLTSARKLGKEEGNRLAQFLEYTCKTCRKACKRKAAMSKELLKKFWLSFCWSMEPAIPPIYCKTDTCPSWWYATRVSALFIYPTS